MDYSPEATPPENPQRATGTDTDSVPAGGKTTDQRGEDADSPPEVLPPPTYSIDQETAGPARPPGGTGRSGLSAFRYRCSDELYARLAGDAQRLTQLTRGIRERVAVMIADISNFSSIAESLPPDRALTVLNIFMNEMIGIVRDRNKGFIYRIAGDSLVCVFGLPYPQRSAFRAASAAGDGQRRMRVVNQELASRGLPEISFGAGIATGLVHTGFVINDRQISDITIFGRAGETAVGLEALAGPGEIVICPETRAELGPDFPAADTGRTVSTKDGSEYAAFRLAWH